MRTKFEFMNKLKAYKIVFCLALIMMLVLGIIIIVDYTSTGTTDGWSGFGAMALTSIAMFLMIRGCKKKERN